MNNPPPIPVVFELEISIERYYVAQVLKAVMSSILFHRTFSNVKPVETSVDQLDISYARTTKTDALCKARVDHCLSIIDQVFIIKRGRIL